MKAFLHGGPEDGSEFCVGICTTPPPFIDVAPPRIGGAAARYTLRTVTISRPGRDEKIDFSYHFEGYIQSERRPDGCAQAR